jgi:hypothetical protein
MEINSDDAGTAIIISIPLTELASTDSQENGESVRSIWAAWGAIARCRNAITPRWKVGGDVMDTEYVWQPLYRAVVLEEDWSKIEQNRAMG